MKKVFDKNGIEITVNCEVEVPTPNDTDIHLTDFVGVVTDILDNGNVIVEDGESDFYEIEAERLAVYDTNGNTLTDEQIERLKKIVSNHFDTPDQI